MCYYSWSHSSSICREWLLLWVSQSGDVGTYDVVPYYLSDPLWDGSGCGNGNGCCAQIGMPWFYRKLQITTAEDFEIRICKHGPSINDEDIAVENLELFML